MLYTVLLAKETIRETLVLAIGHSQLLDHGCGTAFRPTYDSPTLPFISSAGRLKIYLFG